jgi:hypothetical protein
MRPDAKAYAAARLIETANTLANASLTYANAAPAEAEQARKAWQKAHRDWCDAHNALYANAREVALRDDHERGCLSRVAPLSDD